MGCPTPFPSLIYQQGWHFILRQVPRFSGTNRRVVAPLDCTWLSRNLLEHHARPFNSFWVIAPDIWWPISRPYVLGKAFRWSSALWVPIRRYRRHLAYDIKNERCPLPLLSAPRPKSLLDRACGRTAFIVQPILQYSISLEHIRLRHIPVLHLSRTRLTHGRHAAPVAAWLWLLLRHRFLSQP